MTFDLAARLDAARRRMAERGVDALLLSVGSDLPYLLGYRAVENERLTMAVVRADDEAILVVPELEAPRVDALAGVFRVRPWRETESPVSIVAGLAAGAATAAVSDETWARFVLELQVELPATRMIPAGPLMEQLRIVKEPAEIDRLRAAASGVDRVAVRLEKHRFSGKTERRLSQEVGAMTVEEGAEMSHFAIVASGPNGASPHHEPGERLIGPGDVVVVDFGGPVGGYQSDTTRSFVVGEPTAEQAEVHAVVAAAQEAGVRATRPGVACGEVDAAARAVIEAAGWGERFIHRLGHGIGLDVHEEPYLVDGNERLLEPGMTFSIEPGIYLPGRFGVRIEDIAVCTDDGCERLNASNRDLVVVD
ncbi:MAG TPA: Xaa-Pro peptidase family protein [Acidimicrobiia bacterium]|jgi:D-alanyl-D-alanine dipeptidase